MKSLKTEIKKEGFLIEIEYQVVNVPSKPLMVVVPQFEVKYVKDLIKSEIKTPELLVTLAPITPEIILNRGGLLDIQPNSTVKKIKTEGILLKIYIIFILFLIPLVVLLYCWAPWHKFLVRNKMPFSYASLKIKKLKNSSNLVFWKQALTYYHFALNSTANKIVFLDNVDDFFSKNTQYQKFSNEIKFFLLCSRNLFFEGKGCPDEKDKNLFIKTIEQLSLIEKNIG